MRFPAFFKILGGISCALSLLLLSVFLFIMTNYKDNLCARNTFHVVMDNP